MRKSCQRCKFLIHYGGFEYGCSYKGECLPRPCDIVRPDKESLKIDTRDPFSRYSIPKIIKE